MYYLGKNKSKKVNNLFLLYILLKSIRHPQGSLEHTLRAATTLQNSLQLPTAYNKLQSNLQVYQTW